MTIRNLRMFFEITRDMNLCVSAQRLNTTQQSLSGHIKRLETHFGIPLFKRNPRLVLTEAGEELLRESKGILEAEERLLTKFGTHCSDDFGELRIACGMARSRYYMPEVIGTFTAKYPSVSVQFIDDHDFNDQPIFSGNQVDIVIGKPQPHFQGLKSIPLLEMQSYIIISDALLRKTLGESADEFISKASAGLDTKDIPDEIPMAYPRMSKREPWICEKIPELRDRPRMHIDQDNYDILIGLCREGKVMLIISEMYLRYIVKTFSKSIYSGLYFFPQYLDGAPLIFHETLSYDTSRYHPLYFNGFIDIVLDTFNTMKDKFIGCGPDPRTPATSTCLEVV